MPSKSRQDSVGPMPDFRSKENRDLLGPAPEGLSRHQLRQWREDQYSTLMSLQTPQKTSDQKSSKQLNGSTVAANTVVLPTRSKAVAGGSWFGGGNRRRGT